MRVGIEVGGTFTDLVAVDGDRIGIVKVPSTPSSPDIGALASLDAAGVPVRQVDDLVHGSTVATNAILERKGARVAFVTTRGFRDLLFLQRHDRRDIYNLRYRKPAPVVRRKDCFEVDERIGARGDVVVPLDTEAVARQLAPALRQGGYQAVAICLLSSYANPAHEEALQRLLSERLPGVFVTCSSGVSREFREYERASTASLSAFVQPVIGAYLERFSAALATRGFHGRFSVMQSNGGRLPAEGMRRNAISALFSGPAAGVVGAVRQSARSGFRDLVTFDMGGTSTDVCLVESGKPSMSPSTEVDGLPVRTPLLDIVSVGAGGGSLVWIDDGGMLRVGPQSAGADPGPACYARGGVRPTVTDAHVIRGTIRPDSFLGGAMPLDAARAHRAFEALAAELGMGVTEAAASALRLAIANIVRAIQLVSTERGRDPRDYALVPFGGAGPLVAAEIAEEIGISTIVVPPNPGVISAYGLLAADYVQIESVTRRTPVDDGAPRVLVEAFREMCVRAEQRFAELGLGGQLAFDFTAEMRFVGQAFEVPVELPLETLDTLTPAELMRRFAEAHHRVYFHGGQATQPVEIVALRLGVSRPLEALPAFRERRCDLARPASVRLHTGSRAVDARVVASHELEAERPVDGVLLIEGYSSTTYVPAGWRAVRDAHDNVLLRRSGQ